MMSFVEYIRFFDEFIIHLMIQHVILFLIAFAAAVLVGIVLGVLVFRFAALRLLSPVINVLQATPEIVLLALCIPFLGIGYAGALVPLFVKGILPVMQNTVGGLRNVDTNMTEAARGMGMSDRQILFRVELVNSLPVIIAGMRVASVMLISAITLTAYIGVESLGTLILQGIARMDANPLLIGSGLSALLAVIVNQFMIYLERAAMRAVGTRR
jgi:osmoprotectant transport system permease protein